MDKKTLEEIKKKVNTKIQSGELGEPSRALIEPKSKVDFIKKQLCAVFAKYYMDNRDHIKRGDLAKMIGCSPSKLSRIMGYYIDDFTVDFLLQKLEILAEFSTDADKTLKRIALSV